MEPSVSSFILRLFFIFISSFPLILHAQGRERRDDAPQGKIVGRTGVVGNTVYRGYADRAAAARLPDRTLTNRYRTNALRRYDAYYGRYPNVTYGSTYGAMGYPSTVYDGAYGYPNSLNEPNYGVYGYPNTMIDPYYGGTGYNYSMYPNYSNYPIYPNPTAYPNYRSYYYNPGMYNPNTTFVNPPASLNYPTGYPGYSETYFRPR